MKIYINNLNLELLKDISELFKEQLVYSEIFIQLYTNQGIYRIEDKNVFYLDAYDKDINIIENYYNNFTLIMDPSIFHIMPCSNVQGETHLCFHVQKKTYKLNKLSNLSMIIEHYYDINKELISCDIYFEYNKDVDIRDPFIKNELIEFLSVLN
jgi:hypothetical protein